MNFFSKKSVKILLQKHKISPSKKLGQNFLVDKTAIKKIIKSADIRQNDIILEVGPGIGNLTQDLSKVSKKVVAVEKDRKMIEILKEILKDFKNIKIIRGDILKFSNFRPLKPNYKIVANIPFYLTAPLIRKFLESKNPPKEMVLIVQKEVGQRIISRPPRMNILALSVQFYAKAKVVSFLGRKSFWPQPEVDSTVIKIVPKTKGIKKEIINLFFKIVKAGFSQPRKQIINNLSRDLKIKRDEVNKWLRENKVQPNQRAETLDIKDWLSLTKSFKIK